MPTAAFANLGCKVNQYETERIAESFERHGFTTTSFDDPADVYVINTCSVTGAADRKSRHLARQASRRNPGAKVVLTGCFAQAALDTGERVDGADLLVPNAQKMNAAAQVLGAFPDLFPYSSSPAAGAVEGVGSSTMQPLAVFPDMAAGAPGVRAERLHARTRGTLKIQDGCTYFCGFCSIPYTRPVMASRPLRDVLAEARQMADQGVQEIVVTGVCVGAYGPETGSGGARLADALVAVAGVPGIERVRLSSVQPVEVPDDVIDALASNPRIAPHLHLSLQSGDDTVLGAMNRPYDTRFFADHVARLREAVPEIGLTTDLIVGYPGETRPLFENTLAFAERIGFTRTHVFRYSPRQRTHAATLADNVTPDEKERRHKELTAVSLRSQRQFAAGAIGRSVLVLLEGRGAAPGRLSGYTGNYIRVQVDAPISLRGQIVPVMITEITADGDAVGLLRGEQACSEVTDA